MTISLKLLFEAIHQVKDEDELRSHLAPQIGKHFAAKRSGIFFFEQLLADQKFQTVLNLALSFEHNPIARYILDGKCASRPKYNFGTSASIFEH